ncbi:hypothetical protein C8R44DRAFT_868368 [Mycena epipterygia]|nr:hypothetical protein C8R44DRAFT_868368 [Mycena epipterygia]
MAFQTLVALLPCTRHLYWAELDYVVLPGVLFLFLTRPQPAGIPCTIIQEHEYKSKKSAPRIAGDEVEKPPQRRQEHLSALAHTSIRERARGDKAREGEEKSLHRPRDFFCGNLAGSPVFPLPSSLFLSLNRFPLLPRISLSKKARLRIRSKSLAHRVLPVFNRRGWLYSCLRAVVMADAVSAISPDCLFALHRRRRNGLSRSIYWGALRLRYSGALLDHLRGRYALLRRLRAMAADAHDSDLPRLCSATTPHHGIYPQSPTTHLSGFDGCVGVLLYTITASRFICPLGYFLFESPVSYLPDCAPCSSSENRLQARSRHVAHPCCCGRPFVQGPPARACREEGEASAPPVWVRCLALESIWWQDLPASWTLDIKTSLVAARPRLPSAAPTVGHLAVGRGLGPESREPAASTPRLQGCLSCQRWTRALIRLVLPNGCKIETREREELA